jgi:hypothetical protein
MRRSTDSALSRISGAFRSRAVHDHDHLCGLCPVPSSGAAHGRIAVGLHWTSPRDPGRSDDERLGHDPVHDGRLSGRADRRACRAGICDRFGGPDVSRDNPRYRQGTCARPQQLQAFAGLSAGTLGAGALVAFAPAPEQLIFVVLLALSVIETAIIWFMPETANTKPGALASLQPRVRVPRVARATFAAVTPVNIASWSLGGFYFSLMPAVVSAATGTTLPIVGGLVVAALTFSGAVAVVVLRKLAPEKSFCSASSVWRSAC